MGSKNLIYLENKYMNWADYVDGDSDAMDWYPTPTTDIRLLNAGCPLQLYILLWIEKG